MSNEFSLPIALNLAPRRHLTAALVALHCLPLPLLATAPAIIGWPLAAAAAASLAWELHKHRIPATRLFANPANEWRIQHNDQSEKITLLDGAHFGFFTLLLAAKNKTKFRLLIITRQQPKEQSHRLRVWLAQRSGGMKN